MKLRGRPEAPDQSRGCTLSSRTRGDTTDFHGPLQRLLGAMLAIRLTSVTNHGNLNQRSCVGNGVNDAPVSNANSPEVIRTLELSAAGRARVTHQSLDAFENSPRNGVIKRL